MSLMYKEPPADVLRAHHSGLANFDTGAQLGALLLHSSKACSVSILDKTDVADPSKDFDHCVKPAGWRFLAGDSSQAGATHVGAGASPILTGFSGEAEVTDQMGHLPELELLPEVQRGAFELRFLRVPWKRFEAFWLHAKDADDSTRDYVVPYTDFAAAQQVGLKVMTAYRAADFPDLIRTPKTTCESITAVQGVPITQVTMTGSGGLGGPPYKFTATGLQAAGLTITPDGTISGTPTVIGTFPYTVTVKDSVGKTGTVTCSVTVNPPPPPGPPPAPKKPNRKKR